MGDRGAEQQPREQFVLRQGGHAGEGNLRLERRTGHADRRVEVGRIRIGLDIERRIGRHLAAEADHPARQLELATGEFVIAAHQIGAPGDRRIVRRAADLQIRRPFARKPEPADAELVRRARTDIEPPWRRAHFLLLAAAGEIDLADLERRHRARRGRLPEPVAAAIERHVARDHPARTARPQSQRPGNGRPDIVAVDQYGVGGL